MGRLAGVSRWHARGQGFKSPQLHQAQRIGRTPAQGHLPEICQSLTARVGQDTVSADRFRQLGNSRREYHRENFLHRFKAALRAASGGRPRPHPLRQLITD